MTNIKIALGNCEECEDKPIVIEAWYNGQIIYGKDIRPEEYDQLDDFIQEVTESAEDIIQHEQVQEIE